MSDKEELDGKDHKKEALLKIQELEEYVESMSIGGSDFLALCDYLYSDRLWEELKRARNLLAAVKDGPSSDTIQLVEAESQVRLLEWENALLGHRIEVNTAEKPGYNSARSKVHKLTVQLSNAFQIARLHPGLERDQAMQVLYNSRSKVLDHTTNSTQPSPLTQSG